MIIKKLNYIIETNHFGVRRKMGGGWEVFSIAHDSTYEIKDFADQAEAQQWLDYLWGEMINGTRFLEIE